MRKLIIILFIGLTICPVAQAGEENKYQKIFAASDYIVRLNVASFSEQKANPDPYEQTQPIDPDSPANWDWIRLSGFVIEYNHKKWILSAGHGFVDGSLHNIKKIVVFFHNRKKAPLEAELIGFNRRLDVALIKFPNQDLIKDIPAVPFGSSARVKTGQNVLSIGFPSPFTKNQILTSGKVAAICSGINLGFEYPEIIIHDCIINSGSSGSPLLNEEGQVIGVNIAFVMPQLQENNQIDWKRVVQDKFGIAIPIDDIKNALLLLQKGEVRYADITLRFNYSGSYYAGDLEEAGVKVPLPRQGLMVIANPGLAEKAGFQIGDIILTCDGKSVANQKTTDLYRYLYLDPNLSKIVRFEVDRYGIKVTVNLPLSEPKTNKKTPSP